MEGRVANRYDVALSACEPGFVRYPNADGLTSVSGASKAGCYLCSETVQERPPAVVVVPPLREEAHAIGKPRVPFGQLCGQLVVGRLQRKRIEDVVSDDAGHLGPAPALGQRVEFILGLAPAMVLEDRPVGGRRAVEGDLHSGRLTRCVKGSIVGPGHDERADPDLEVFASSCRPCEPSLECRDLPFSDIPGCGERVKEDAVGHLAGELAHAVSQRAQEDARRSIRTRGRAEEGSHQGVLVEAATEVEALAGVPGPPDRSKSQDEL